MAALEALEILPENLKIYNQIPDNLVSLPCARVFREQKTLDFFSFYCHFLSTSSGHCRSV